MRTTLSNLQSYEIDSGVLCSNCDVFLSNLHACCRNSWLVRNKSDQARGVTISLQTDQTRITADVVIVIVYYSHEISITPQTAKSPEPTQNKGAKSKHRRGMKSVPSQNPTGYAGRKLHSTNQRQKMMRRHALLSSTLVHVIGRTFEPGSYLSF